MSKSTESRSRHGLLAAWSGLLLAFVCGTAAAHHSFNAQYDADKPQTLTGEVIRVQWSNPHIYYYMSVKDEAGQATEWAIEISAPNALFRQGWRKDTLKPGDTVTVEGFLARNGANQLNGRNTTLSDGRRLFSGSNDGAPQ